MVPRRLGRPVRPRPAARCQGYGHSPEEVGEGARVRRTCWPATTTRVHKATLEYIASVTPEELEPRRRHALDPAGDRQRAAGQHRRRQRPAPRPGGLRAGHRRLIAGDPMVAAGRAGGADRCSGLAVGAASDPAGRLVPPVRATALCVSWLLLFTDPRGARRPAGLSVGGAALHRRWWRFAAVAVVLPRRRDLVAQAASSRCSAGTRDGALAYPSGHTTTSTVVVLGWSSWWPAAALWAVLIAVGYVALGDGRRGRHVPLLHRHDRCACCSAPRSCASPRWSPGGT